MRRRLRQAGRAAGHVGHHGLRFVGTLALVVLLLFGAAAWRLARGPVDLPPLADRIGLAASRALPGFRVTVGEAALAWEGFHHGGAPLDLRLSGITIVGRDGGTAAAISRLRVTLAPLPLLRGRIAPIRIFATAPSIVLVPSKRAEASALASPKLLGRILRVMSEAPAAGGLDLARLRRIRIRRARLDVPGGAGRPDFRATDGRLDLARAPDTTLNGSAGATLRHGGQAVKLAFAIHGRGGLGTIDARLGPFDPSDFAPPLASLDLPVVVTAHWPIGRLAPARLDLTLTGGAGTLRIGTGGVPVAKIAATAVATPEHAELTGATVALAGPDGGAGPIVHATGIVALAGAEHTTLDVTIDHVTAQALPRYWPTGLAKQARHYVTNHIPAGNARNGVFHAGFDLAPHPKLVGFVGKFAASEVTLDWFKHATPMTDLAGTLTFTDPDNLVIAVESGQLGGLALHGTMRITHLTQHDQDGDIAASAAGPVAAAVSLLDAPPLDLAAHGASFAGATGNVKAAFNVSLPLKKHLVLADVRLAASADFTSLHLPLPVSGLALEQGTMALTASNHNLALHGGGILAGSAADFAARMALPDGIFHLTGRTTITQAAIARLGAAPDFVSDFWRGGNAPLAVDYADDRGNATLTLGADLAGVALAAPEFGWSKPIATQGRAAVTLALRHGKPQAISMIDVTAPGLELRGRQQGKALAIEAARIGTMRASGRLVPPVSAGLPWQLALAGPILDLSGVLARARKDAMATSRPAQAAQAGPAWRLRAAFDNLRLHPAPSAPLGPVHVEAAGRAGALSALAATVRIGADGAAKLSYAHAGGTADLALDSNDAGALFAASGISDNIAHGTLALTAATTGGATKGRAILTDFRLRHAPVIAKVLQGISLYGVPAATSGPGLAFTRLTAPFRIANSRIDLGSGRAFSPSLGFTATGSVDLASKRYDLSGTIVPAYALNTLPGRIPLIGKLFSPEKGGGLFAARYTVSGPFARPHIVVNPLAALAPGFIREIFGLGAAMGTPAAKNGKTP